MRFYLSIIAIWLYLIGYSQTCTTLVKYDYIETWNWASAWAVGPNVGYYTNAAVSASASAALIGGGNGSSGIESGFYVLPNVTGLNATSSYILKFRLAAYRFSNSVAATAGVDNPDYVDLQLSTNGGTSYVSELRITGNANARWSYSSTATASKTANGTLTTLTPAGGGDRTSTGDGYSYIQLNIPAGITQCAFYIYCRVNSAGEEWWIDNIELFEVAPCAPLPIELVDFTAEPREDYNLILWKTATELNNNYFLLSRSEDAINWSEINIVNSVGNSTTIKNYEYYDYSYPSGINYYQLKQVDFNGNFKIFKLVSVDNRKSLNATLIRVTDALGRDATENSEGFLIYHFSDGSFKKVIR